MTSAFQQGKLMQWGFDNGRETGSSLSSDSSIELPPRSVKRYMLCQNLYLKYVIKLVKLCCKQLGYGSLPNLSFHYHSSQLDAVGLPLIVHLKQAASMENFGL